MVPVEDEHTLRYPLVIKHGNGKSPVYKIIVPLEPPLISPLATLPEGMTHEISHIINQY
jgi:hypothetical protein